MNTNVYDNVENSFIDYLKSYGYPAECIALEWGNSKFTVDVAVLAKDLVTPIAVYEIKIRKTPDIIRRGIDNLKRIVSIYKITVPCTLVLGTDNGTLFEVVDVTKNVYSNEPIDISSLMAPHPLTKPVSYDNLQAGSTSKALARKISNRQERIDRIKWFCWLLFPVVAVVLLILDALDIYQLTALRLTVVGAVVVVVLIPFFSEISLKDFTFKRKNDK